MTDSCCCPLQAGNTVCELTPDNIERQHSATNACPVCGKKGKLVQTQTVKALLSASLRAVQDVDYLFCRSSDCPVVYFSPDGEQTFTLDQVREHIYQKEPDNDDGLVCYCFQHTMGEIRNASSATRIAIEEDINAGINSGQCACDLRNPQGSCCLGNVRRLIKRFDALATDDLISD